MPRIGMFCARLNALAKEIPTNKEPISPGPLVTAIVPHLGDYIEIHPYDDEPFTALAFKIMTDPYVGKLTFLRVYSVV